MIIRIHTIFILSLITLFAYGQSDPKPCYCCTDNHRQFDFWLGEWEVKNNGKLAGKNSITLVQDSCLIREEWISAGNAYTGTSYNFYNEEKDQWQQLWVDNQGGYLELTGKFEKGEMVLKSDEMTNRQGEKYINRITWTPKPDGSVRQHWETSKDQGIHWETLFDGLYLKIKK